MKKQKKEAHRLTDNYSAFMDMDLTPYAGEWVAICDGRIVSHDQSLREALEIAMKQCPNEKPLMAKVPTADTLIL